MSEDDPQRTPDELCILKQMVEQRGKEYVEDNEELILAQARLVGDL